MRISKAIRWVNCFLLALFLISVIYFPNDTFQTKKLSFVLLIAINILSFFRINSKNKRIVLLLGFCLPTYLIIKSILLTGTVMDNVMTGFSGYLLLLYFVVSDYKLDFEKYFLMVLSSMAIFLIVMALLHFAHVLPTLKNPLLMYFYWTDNAMIGVGAQYPLGIIYFMKTSPMFLVAIPYYMKKKNYLMAFVMVGALVLSGTRANALMGFFVFATTFVYLDTNKFRRWVVVLLEITALLAILFGTNIVDRIIGLFTMKKDNDDIRTLTLESMFRDWKNNPLSLIIGSGFSSTFFSTGRMEMVSNVELSYWNLLRQVGIIPFVLLMFLFLYPMICLVRGKTYMVFGYLAYLIVAYTNPLLYSSTGVTVLLYFYYLIGKEMPKKAYYDLANPVQSLEINLYYE